MLRNIREKQRSPLHRGVGLNSRNTLQNTTAKDAQTFVNTAAVVIQTVKRDGIWTAVFWLTAGRQKPAALQINENPQ
jgi:hypothetical protein